MFMNMAISDYCPHADRSLHTLMYEYTLPMIYRLKEFIDIRESYDMALHKDQEDKNSKK